jgi:hypothetical protein
MPHWRLALIAALLWLGATRPQPAAAQEPLPIPAGFRLTLSAPGVALYQKDYAKGNPDFVQVIDLSAGARLELLHGGQAGRGEGKGVYGGDNPKFDRLPLSSFWKLARQEAPTTFCVLNGAFFYLPDSPTRLAFPLKLDGVVLTDGYGINEYPEQKLMLALRPGYAELTDLTPEGLYGSDAPDILGGLTEAANKKARFALGRTFLGLADRDGDGLNETILLLSTLSAAQVDAAEVLRSFGANAVMMLDGGGSTQLLCQGQDIIASERVIPQALAVVAAAGPDELVIPETPPPSVTPTAPAPTATPLVNRQEAASPGRAYLAALLGGETAAAAADSAATAPPAPLRIDLGGLLLIPGVMMPLSLVILALIRRGRS